MTTSKPWWIWFVLLLAVLACSSGGIWFKLLPNVPPVLRAAWRLLVTSLMQFPMFLHDLIHTKVGHGEYFDLQLYFIVSGTALAMHFAAWSISLTLTSLSHSLLFVCTTPLLLVAYQAAGYVFGFGYYPPTWIECIGAGVGFAAAAVLALEAGDSDNESVSLLGDLVAIMGAAAMGVYLSTGAKARRTSVTVWMYVFPVTLIGGVICLIGSWVFEPNAWQHHSSNMDFYIVFCAAFTSGILGHTFVNLALGYVDPLVVAVLLLSEPLMGSLLGFAVGVQQELSLVTILCGFPLMLSACLVVLGARGTWLHRHCC